MENYPKANGRWNRCEKRQLSKQGELHLWGRHENCLVSKEEKLICVCQRCNTHKTSRS